MKPLLSLAAALLTTTAASTLAYAGSPVNAAPAHNQAHPSSTPPATHATHATHEQAPQRTGLSRWFHRATPGAKETPKGEPLAVGAKAGEKPAANAHAAAAAHGATALSPENAKIAAGPHALLPNGKPIAPDNFDGGYHGTTLITPEKALHDGFGQRGTNLDLREHSEEKGDTAFRGTTTFPADASGNGGTASDWAGEGGWVYEIRGVPTWDVNKHLEGRVQVGASYRGNLMHGETEHAIPARVESYQIRRYGKVEADSTGRLLVRRWVANPGYHAAGTAGATP